MDFQQMLWEILAGQPKPGPVGPHGVPMGTPQAPGIQMPQTTVMGGRAPMPAQITPPSLPPGGGVGGSPMDSMAMNPLWGGGKGPLPTPPGMAGSGMSPHAGPPGPSLLAGPQPPTAGGPGMVQPPVQNFRQQASGLFGGKQFNLGTLLADAMAGAAAGDPTAPPIKAFAQGFTGARASKKLREKDATDAEDKAYEREGTDQERAESSQRLKMDERKWKLDNILKLIEIAQQNAGGDPNKFRQELIKSSANSPLGVLDQADLDRAMGMAFPGQNKPNAAGGQKPPPGTKIQKGGRTLQYDATRDVWLDEQGQPVDLPAM